jgi:lantibiotic transport system permease protein
MFMSFLHSFQSEWMKKKRSLASWLVVIGGFFTPLIIIIARLLYPRQLPGEYLSPGFWNKLWGSAWESMALFLLPIGVILAGSLITQIEYKNNTWKQLYTTPLKLSTIFFSKLLVIVVMLLQFFVLFNIGIYLAALIPYLFVPGVSYPKAPIPVMTVLKENGFFFIDCLPIIALQYLASLQYKNFLAPVGLGLALWIASIAALSWKYGYLIPYTYTMFNYVKGQTGSRAIQPMINIHLMAISYFIIITAINYILYITKKEKG